MVFIFEKSVTFFVRSPLKVLKKVTKSLLLRIYNSLLKFHFFVKIPYNCEMDEQNIAVCPGV